MKTTTIFVLTLAAALSARADFSYTETQKNAQGAPTGQSTKHYLKGQKMKMEAGSTATIMDFDAQTVTVINHTQKNYSVKPFSEMAQALKQTNLDVKADVKETGQRKTINGFNAKEVLMTMEMDSPQAGPAGKMQAGKMQVEMSMWLSSDVPGAGEMRSFYQKNASRMPWAALAGGGANPGMQKAMADMQQKIASMDGVPVLQVMKMKSAGNPAQAEQMQKAMAQMQAQMEAMKKAGGQQAAAAAQMEARMAGMMGGSGALFEITMEAGDFSSASVPDSVFAIPAGYQKK